MNFFELGPQNSRGFRALKVWLALRQVGRDGYRRMIADDMLLAEHLHDRVSRHPEFEPVTQSLSITTFRYVPSDLRRRLACDATEAYLDRLNRELLVAVERERRRVPVERGVNGRFALSRLRGELSHVSGRHRGCCRLVSRLGREIDAALRHEPGRACAWLQAFRPAEFKKESAMSNTRRERLIRRWRRARRPRRWPPARAGHRRVDRLRNTLDRDSSGRRRSRRTAAGRRGGAPRASVFPIEIQLAQGSRRGRRSPA